MSRKDQVHFWIENTYLAPMEEKDNSLEDINTVEQDCFCKFGLSLSKQIPKTTFNNINQSECLAFATLRGGR